MSDTAPLNRMICVVETASIGAAMLAKLSRASATAPGVVDIVQTQRMPTEYSKDVQFQWFKPVQLRNAVEQKDGSLSYEPRNRHERRKATSPRYCNAGR
jgi:hypothetical protein